MAKKQLNTQDVQGRLKILESILDDNGEIYRDEMANILFGEADKFKQFLDFSKGKGNLQEWIENNRLIFGLPFRYDYAGMSIMLGEKDTKPEKCFRPYLNQYANDISKEKSCIKCRQSELTEHEINDNTYLCCSRPYTNVRHVFPTAGMASKIAREKISPAIDNSPRIAMQLRHPKNITVKAFSNGSFYTVDSSWADYQGRGPSSDKITFDEYESHNPHIEEIYSESTSHSALGIRVRISTPLFPDSGIDEKFKRGTQFEWVITCHKCGKEQQMTFPDNIIGFFDINSEIDPDSEEYQKKLNKVYIGCRHCGAYIDRNSKQYIQTSRWVPNKKHFIGTRASYRITYFMLAWKTGKEILFKYHSFKFVNQFWNEVIGYAYVSPEAKISRETFEQCQDLSLANQFQKVGNTKNVSVGVDWGPETSYVVVRGNGILPYPKKPKVLYIEKINKENLQKYRFKGEKNDHVKRVVEIANFFNARIIVNDANGPGVDRDAYLAKVFPNKSFGVFYDTNEVDKQKHREKLIIPQWSEGTNRVTVSRLMTLKLLVQEYEEKQIEIPRLDGLMDEFIKHHANLVVERYHDEKTDSIYEIIGHTGPDHFAHADNYAKIGFDRLVNVYREGAAIGIINSTAPKTKRQIQDQIINEDNIHPLLRGNK